MGNPPVEAGRNRATATALLGAPFGGPATELPKTPSRDALVLPTGLLAGGYALDQAKKQPDGVEIPVGRNGLSIKEK